jgi:hypothetical protein
LIGALTKHAAGKEDYADIVAMLPSVFPVAPEKIARPKVVSEGFVYLIQSGDFCKIGRSDEIERPSKKSELRCLTKQLSFTLLEPMIRLE